MPCNDLISNADIQNIYESCRCVDQTNIIESKCDDINKKIVRINLYKKMNIINKYPIKRCYIRNAPLRSIIGEGKVVIHELFVLKEDYRGNKITEKFHKKEIEIYAKNEFVEIQLEAAWTGITHWPKLGYKFYKLDDYDHILYMLWSAFFFEKFSMDPERKKEIVSTYKTYKEVPKKYQKGFGEWLLDNRKNCAFPMYKVIEKPRR